MSEPIRVFVGCPGNNEDLECQSVFEWSLRKHTTRDVEITWMMLSKDPQSFWYSNPITRQGWHTQTWATPFSALRWGIPAACGFQGKAIYCDSDMMLRADVGGLWDQPFKPGKAVMAKGGDEIISCTMMFDCEAIQPFLPSAADLKSKPGLYRNVRAMLRGKSQDYDGDWNCRDGEKYADINDPRIKLLHYTSIPTQPNHKHARERLAREGKDPIRDHWYPGPDRPHKRPEFAEIFDQLFAEAKENGYGVERYRMAQEFGAYGR